MDKHTEELLTLIKENPELPVIPMVSYEVVADDTYNWWLGEWSYSKVKEYYKGREGIHFKSDDEEDVLADMIGCEYYKDLNGKDITELSDEEWDALYENIPWKKAIVVYIDV